MLTLLIAIAIMFIVVGASVRWATRAERRRIVMEEADAGHH